MTYAQWKQWTGFFVAAAGGDGRDIPERFFKRYWKKGYDAMATARQYLQDVTDGAYLQDIERQRAV